MAMKRVLITGASGLLGQQVRQRLSQLGYLTIGLRHSKKTQCDIEIQALNELPSVTGEKLDLVINLAGAPIAERLWTEKRKQQLRSSRIDQTYDLIEALVKSGCQVRHFISASAIGYYGTGKQVKNEQDEAGNDFSAQLCRDWEDLAQSASGLSQHITIIRTGLVLSPKGGYLGPQRLPALFGLAATFGDGTQGVSWIDHRDWLSAIEHIIRNDIDGALNLTSPNPCSQADFLQAFCQSIHRPLWFKLPRFLFAPFGEMKSLFIEGQFIQPTRLLQSGFKFQFGELTKSLNSLRD